MIIEKMRYRGGIGERIKLNHRGPPRQRIFALKLKLDSLRGTLSVATNDNPILGIVFFLDAMPRLHTCMKELIDYLNENSINEFDEVIEDLRVLKRLQEEKFNLFNNLEEITSENARELLTSCIQTLNIGIANLVT